MWTAVEHERQIQGLGNVISKVKETTKKNINSNGKCNGRDNENDNVNEKEERERDGENGRSRTNYTTTNPSSKQKLYIGKGTGGETTMKAWA